jgi:hypothetical protein
MSNTIKLGLWVLAMCWTVSGFTQYATQYSLYTHERYAFNPAFAGMERSWQFLFNTDPNGRDWPGILNPEWSMSICHFTSGRELLDFNCIMNP